MDFPFQIENYHVIERLAVGGMAEIFLAKRMGPAKFQKTVALKRLLPDIAEDKAFTAMFLDEARLAAQLHHPNIVQIFDLGISNGAYFIVMEHLIGKDLSGVQKQLGLRNASIEQPLAAKIISLSADALHYAHTLKDADDQPLHLIHRDVSPQNLFLTSNGQVKLMDFGIAKAVRRSVKTETGVLKGKLAYMAPEQLLGQPADQRSDLYASA